MDAKLAGPHSGPKGFRDEVWQESGLKSTMPVDLWVRRVRMGLCPRKELAHSRGTCRPNPKNGCKSNAPPARRPPACPTRPPRPPAPTPARPSHCGARAFSFDPAGLVFGSPGASRTHH